MRIALRALTTLSLLASLLVAGHAAPVQAQQTDSTTTVVVDDGDSPINNIVPRPNSGRAPDSPNDPGGWMQYMVFGLILLGLVAIVGLVVRESRRARQQRGDGSPLPR